MIEIICIFCELLPLCSVTHVAPLYPKRFHSFDWRWFPIEILHYAK